MKKLFVLALVIAALSGVNSIAQQDQTVPAAAVPTVTKAALISDRQFDADVTSALLSAGLITSPHDGSGPIQDCRPIGHGCCVMIDGTMVCCSPPFCDQNRGAVPTDRPKEHV